MSKSQGPKICRFRTLGRNVFQQDPKCLKPGTFRTLRIFQTQDVSDPGFGHFRPSVSSSSVVLFRPSLQNVHHQKISTGIILMLEDRSFIPKFQTKTAVVV